jgi:predicted membrane protein
MREKIWYYMLDSKFQSLYLDYQVSKYQKYDRNINIFLALASSSSIGAWAIWNEYQIIWAIIIAAAYVVNIIKPYFPYSKYIKELNERALSMQNLHLDYERLWYKFDNDQVNEDIATEKFFDLKSKGITNLRLNDDTLVFEDDNIYRVAEVKMKSYVKNNYNVEY